MRHRAIELRNAAVDRVHAPPDEVARDAGLAAIAPAHRLAHEALGAVRAHEVFAPHDARRAAGGRLRVHIDMVALRVKARDAPAVMNARDALGVPAQHLLDVFLRHAMRQLGGAPRAGERRHHRARLARRRQAKAREFVFGEAREVGDVGRKLGRQAERADLIGEAKPPVVLHRARLRRVRLGVERGARFLVEHQRFDAALDGEHQAAGAAADDHHLGSLREHARILEREEVPKGLADPGELSALARRSGNPSCAHTITRFL